MSREKLMRAYIEALRKKQKATPIPLPDVSPVDIDSPPDETQPDPGNDKRLPLRKQDRIVRT